MESDKEKKEKSGISPMEIMLFLAGIFFLVTGCVRHDELPIFWGVLIITGSVVLHFVKKKDWKKHWEEQERRKLVYEEMERLKKEKNGKGKS